MSLEHKMIEPFTTAGAGRSDQLRRVFLRLRYSRRGRVPDLHQCELDHRRSKNFDSRSLVEYKGDVCIIPPNSFAWRSVEYFRIRATCSRLRREVDLRAVRNHREVTPFEPEWKFRNSRISNTTPLQRRFANEDCASDFLRVRRRLRNQLQR